MLKLRRRQGASHGRRTSWVFEQDHWDLDEMRRHVESAERDLRSGKRDAVRSVIEIETRAGERKLREEGRQGFKHRGMNVERNVKNRGWHRLLMHFWSRGKILRSRSHHFGSLRPTLCGD